jgi:hypothetical protein
MDPLVEIKKLISDAKDIKFRIKNRERLFRISNFPNRTSDVSIKYDFRNIMDMSFEDLSRYHYYQSLQDTVISWKRKTEEWLVLSRYDAISLEFAGLSDGFPMIHNSDFEIETTFLTKAINCLVNLSKQIEFSQPKIDTTKFPSLKLSDVFGDVIKYYSIMNLLVERCHCQEHTFLWKDEIGGNKGFLIAIIKDLHSKGYYRNNKKLTTEEIKTIAQNTFGLSISKDTIKHTKTVNFDLSFIPIASTLS